MEAKDIILIIVATIVGILLIARIIYLLASKAVGANNRKLQYRKKSQSKVATHSDPFLSSGAAYNSVTHASPSQGNNFEGFGGGEGGGAGAGGSWESSDSDSGSADSGGSND